MRATVVLSAVLLFLTACTTTPTSRRQAADLADRMGEYQQEQRKRIDDLNQQYRRSQGRLMEALARHAEDELRQALDLDALRNADLLLTDWEKTTLPGQFRDLLEKNVASERAKIEDIDRRLAEARVAYADAYKEARLDVARLDTVRNALIAVSKANRAQDLSELVTLVTKIYQCLKAQRDAGTTTAAPPPSGAPTPTKPDGACK